MIAQEINFNQRSSEWNEIRLGKITSSNISLILGNPKKKGEVLTQTAQSHIIKLVSGLLCGGYKELSTPALQWGIDHEAEAISTYEAHTMTKVKDCSFFECVNNPLYGGSPDGIIYPQQKEDKTISDKRNIIEVKCPFNSENHVKTLLNGMPKEHMAQIQSNIYLTEAEHCDFISYDPRILDDRKKLYIERIPRDEDYINTMLEKINIFTEELKKQIGELTT